MRQIKLKRGFIAGILVLLMTLCSLYLSQASAAGAVDTSRTCTLTLTVAEDSMFSQELSEMELTVRLYRVADMTENGTYSSLEGYEELKLEDLKAEGDASAKLWAANALQAAELASEREADAETVLTEGSTPKIELPVGMYLVLADTVQSPEYEYSFTPYLISLPNNLYPSTGSDDWIYDVTAGLKPGQEPLYGSLLIRKTLTGYNAALGNTTFVFQIEAVRDSETVYSNVVATTHSAAGTKEVLVEHLPAGAQVTVTEIYSGASYELTSPRTQSTVIVAEDTEGTPAVVGFTNTYNNQLNSGYGVSNHFEFNEENGWNWELRKDNSTQIE